MSKRANNDGSIFFDKSKKIWRAMFTTPLGKRLTKSSKNKDAVVDWFNEQKLLIGRNEHIEPHSITLLEWATEWLETYAKIKVKPRTYDRYISLIKHFKPIYDIKLINLRPVDLQKIYNGMLDKYSSQTIIHASNCISGCLKQAVENGLIRDNVASKTKKPKLQKKDIEIFTPKEIVMLLEECEKYRNSLVVPLTYFTGLRLSEVLALRCEDVDLKNNTLTVSQTVHSSASNGIYYSDTKSTSSNRTIKLNNSVVKMVLEHKLKYGINTGLLFLNRKKTGETPSNYLRYTFSRIQKAINVTKGFHVLRHTHATELLAEGMPVYDVSRRLGHSKTSITLDVYIHHLPNSDEKMENALDLLMQKKEATKRITFDNLL